MYRANKQGTECANAQIYLKPSLMYRDDERIRSDANGPLTSIAFASNMIYTSREKCNEMKIRVRRWFARKVECVDRDFFVYT